MLRGKRKKRPSLVTARSQFQARDTVFRLFSDSQE